jgi:ATPase involved in DNA replication initiation
VADPDPPPRNVSRQLVLDLPHEPSLAAEDFLESPSNAEALTMIERWPDWPDRTLLVVGPAGSGKSHLGAIWAERAQAQAIRPGTALAGGSGPLVALIEDGDRAAYPEAAFFHVLNHVRESGGWCVVTARKPPTLWGLTTPDLVSRLRLAPSVPIGRPDAALMRAVLVKLFADRQIHIEEDVVAYAARHCEQSLEAVNTFVAAIDEKSLAEGRRITRQLAARTVAALERDTPASE